MGTGHDRRASRGGPVGAWVATVAGLALAASAVGQTTQTWPPTESASASVYARPAPPSGASTPLPPVALPPVEPYRLEERPAAASPSGFGPAAHDAVGHDPAGHGHGAHGPGTAGMRPAVPLGASGAGTGFSPGGPAGLPPGADRPSTFPPAGRPAGGPPANRFGSPPVGRPEDYARVAMTSSPIPAELPLAEQAGPEIKTPLPRRGEGDGADASAPAAKSPWASAGTTIVSLAAVVGLFVAVMLVQKRLRGATPTARMPGEILESLGSVPAGPRAEYRLVRFADRVLLLHAQGTTVVTLSEVTDLDTVEHLVTICRQHQKDALPTGLRRLIAGGQAAAASERRVRAIA